MMFSKTCDITGIIAVACARHGCFAPNSIVDLTRGEQQKIADWAFLEQLRTTGVRPEQGAMLIYDIACQYFVYLQERIGHLIPDGLEIDRAIGLFHVHDHKESCFYRFASSFIPGSGVVAGEILESLWANLNTITPSTRTATHAHRAEIIDDHATDSNHKKALSMGERLNNPISVFPMDILASGLSNRFIHATEMVRLTQNYYDQMSGTVSASLRNQWQKEITHAECHRLSNPAIMDLMGAKEANHEQQPNPSPDRPECSAFQWLTLAIAIEEKQSVIFIEMVLLIVRALCQDRHSRPDSEVDNTAP